MEAKLGFRGVWVWLGVTGALRDAGWGRSNAGHRAGPKKARALFVLGRLTCQKMGKIMAR